VCFDEDTCDACRESPHDMSFDVLVQRHTSTVTCGVARTQITILRV
jgi:hypothetical protein